MSTTPPVSPHPAVSREHLLDLVSDAYSRGGQGPLEHDVIDIVLADVADKAACSLLRDRWDDNFPIAAYNELLTAVAALRAVLGFDASPTAPEVIAWSRRLGERLGGEIDGPTSPSFIRFVGGPYNGVVLSVPGSVDQGPAPVLPLPVAWGDTAEPGRGEARYLRDKAAAREGLWLYWLDGDVPEDARPHITPEPNRAGE